jgi:tRNA(adenine34) deaminase
MTFSAFDKKMMNLAIQEALISISKNEVPIGSVLTKNKKVLGKGHNLSIAKNDPTAHAEIVTIRNACNKINNYRLTDTTLYTTLEPCLMCFGAIINSRIERLVIGALDEEKGAPISNREFLNKLDLNHKVEIEVGLYGERCSEILKKFFQKKRLNRKLCPDRGMV